MHKFIPPSQSPVQHLCRILLCIAGALCLAYYALVAFVAGLIHTSILFIWIVGGLFFWTLAVFTPPICAFLHKAKKRTIALLALLPTVALCLFIAGEAVILSGFVADLPNGDADYLIVLGAKVNPDGPSLTLQTRIDAAYEYLIQHPDTKVIASGGQGADEPMSEAQCIAKELKDLGIAADRILLEDQSTDTAENIRYSQKLIETETNPTVLVVSNDFHCFRAACIARKYLDAQVGHLPADSILFLLPHYMVREFAGLTVDFLQGNLSL